MRIVIVCLLLAAVVAAAFSLASGQRTLAELRAANQELQAQLDARRAALNPSPAAASSDAAAAFSSREMTELLALRGQIRPLRSELAGLSNRLSQLTAPPPPAPGPRSP